VHRVVARAFALLLFFGVTLSSSSATALSFQVDFRQSSYQVVGGDTFDDLMLEHASGSLISSNILQAAEGISSSVYAGNISGDYSLLISTDIVVAAGGTFELQIGTDWGRGGGGRVVNNDNSNVLYDYVTTDDIWWANNWNHADVISTGPMVLTAGSSYTLAWVGFEGCCAGSATIRYSYNGGAFQTLEESTFDPLIVPAPEPGTALLLGLGLLLMSLGRRHLHRR